MAPKKTRVFSGVQPTGNLHLGNYLGAIRLRRAAGRARLPLLRRRPARHHHLAGPRRAADKTREVAAAFIAAGSIRSRTSSSTRAGVRHAELAWIFNCVARMGWLNRMTQFKEKAGKDRENASAGLYAYPALMAADILPTAPRTCRSARTRSSTSSSPATSPEVQQRLRRHRSPRTGYRRRLLPADRAADPGPATRVMSLRDGTKKMSKSDPSDSRAST